MTQPLRSDRRFEPEFLGPLSDRPLAGQAGSSDADSLFPGMSAFLGGRHRRRRRQQWEAIRPLIAKLLKDDEHLLHVAHGMQVPPPLDGLALGAMALSYHQVMLVFTDTRVIEVLLGLRGMKVGTRVRSFPWSGVRELKQRFTKLVLKPASGKKQTWRIALRGDRKLLKMLVPRIAPRLMTGGAGVAQPLPLWHCPQCAAAVPAKPLACASCRTSFRSPRLAALLSLAFPGAGLFYAGHPFLAAADLLGEVVFYLIFLMMMLEAEPGGVAIAAGVGAVLFAITKLQSAHVSQVLVSRSKPEPETTRAGYRKFMLAGGLASLMLIGGAFPLAGAARAIVDRDLDVAGQGSLWQGTRDVGRWLAFADDPYARSQWQSTDGSVVTLFAYPQHLLDGVSEFRNGVRQGLKQQGAAIVKEDEDVPSPFHGFRFVSQAVSSEGETISTAQIFVVDEEHRDIHQVMSATLDEDPSSAETAVRDLLMHARWIGSSPPDRAAAVAQTGR